MPTLSFALTDTGKLTSRSANGWPAVSRSQTVTVSGIPANTTISSAILTYSSSNPAVSGVCYVTIGSTQFNLSRNVTAATVNVTSAITGNAAYTFTFTYDPNSSSSYTESTISFSNMTLVVTYNYTYTACTAPTSVSVSANNVAPGASVTLSWSGAKAGTNNAITGYHIYRSTSSSGTYSHTYTVNTTATSGSCTVTAPTTNGSAYYYKVYTIGSVGGYNSGESGVASLTCSYSAPTAPTTITINGSSSSYVAENGTATLSWSGAKAGTNNEITGYNIYCGDTLYSQQGASIASISISAFTAGARTWTVQTIGTYSSSAKSAGVICYTYSNPTAPTSVSVSNVSPEAGTSVTLSWSGAAAGSYNNITGYRIYRSGSANGAYVLLTTVSSTATSGSCSVTAPSTMGSSYYYKVETVGARSSSGMSSYAALTTILHTACTAPTSVFVSANNVAPGASVTLFWSGAKAGTNNAITGYHIYRSTDGGSNYSFLMNINSTSTGGNATVVAAATPATTYIYRVYTIGTVSGYNSGASTAVALTTYSYTNCTAPSIITISSSSVEAGASATLSWSGASAGISNPITGYEIYRSTTAEGTYSLIETISSTSTSGNTTVIAPSDEGASYCFKIKTIGTVSGYDSSLSNYVIISTIIHTDCIAPSFCKLTSSLSHLATTLFWDDAKDGTNNAVVGYTIERCESIDGSSWGDWSILTSQISTSLEVEPPTIYGNYYWYRVKANGEVSDSPYTNCIHTFRRDYQPIVDFTDTLTANETYIKAIHMQELQQAIRMLLNFYQLDEQSMTEIISGVTSLNGWSGHVNEIRNAIDFLTTYHDDWLDILVNQPRADVMQQMRNMFESVAKPKFALGFGKAGAVVLEGEEDSTSSVLGEAILGIMKIGG